MIDADVKMPPLPEPVVHRCEWDTSSGGVWSQYHDNESDPLPSKWDDESPDVIQGFYSGDQMRDRDAIWADQLRAAVLAERERFRAMFDEALADHGITWPGEVDILYEKMFLAAIRKGTP